MTLEQQVTSKDLSKRLEELGVKQESLFYWNKVGSLGHLEYHIGYEGLEDGRGEISAFTVAELGSLLPERFLSWLTADGWVASFPLDYDNKELRQHGEYAPTEAEARGLMLEYLIKNKLI